MTLPSRAAEAQLHRFLTDAFTADELRRFLHIYLPEGKQLLAALPGDRASLDELTADVVRALSRRGHLDRQLFEALLHERPRRGREIHAIAAAFGLPGLEDPTRRRPQPGHRPAIFLLCAADGLDAAKSLLPHLEDHPRISLDVHIISPPEWPQIAPRPGGQAPLCAALVTAGLIDAPELRGVIDRHRRGELRVQPVLLQTTSWRTTYLGRIPPIPESGVPVDQWPDPRDAWTEVALGLHRALHSAVAQPPAASESPLGQPLGAPTQEILAKKAQASPSREIAVAPPQRRSGRSEPAAPRDHEHLSFEADHADHADHVDLEDPAAPAEDRAAARALDLSADRPAPPPTPQARPAPPLGIDKIFRTTGAPDINFVAPDQLPELSARLRFMGEGLVVDGPSGIGKTTAVRHALSERLGAAYPASVTWLSSKSDADLQALSELLARGHSALRGLVIIDDFHRLPRPQQAQVADLMKLVADDDIDAKLVIIGINPVGLSLVQDFPDLAGRFVVITMTKQPDAKIDALIRRGEEAGNLTFERRGAFVQAARGSFFTAQLLCLEAALLDGVLERPEQPRVVVRGPDGVVLDRVHARLKFKYHDALRSFASHDQRPPPRGATLCLLWLLSASAESSVALVTARSRYPDLALAFDWLLGGALTKLFAESARLRELLFYNPDAGVLSAEDPQLDFFLQHLSWPALARDSGHTDLDWHPERGPSPREPAPAPARRPTGAEPVTTAPEEPATDPLGERPRARILHLSDLHFGDPQQAVLWYSQLLSDLRGELRVDRLDAVVLSGDISERAAGGEFDAAAQFLSDLREDFGLSPADFIIVPGNHDQSWPHSKRAYKLHRRGEFPGASELTAGAFIDNGPVIEVPERAELNQRFEPFAEFFYRVRHEAYPLDPDYQATLHHFSRQRLLILGLNSSWRIDHHFRARADINAVALGRALRSIERERDYLDCLKIAVWHHPLREIPDTGFIERLAAAGFRFALHGHIHRPLTELYRYDMSTAGRRLDLLGAGTFGAPTHAWVPGFPLQYQLLELRGATLHVHTRRREEPSGAWRPDARWTHGPGAAPTAFYELDL
jgi:hypothetical protein